MGTIWKLVTDYLGKSDFKTISYGALALLIMFLIGFGAGKMSKPTKVVKQQVETTQQVKDVQQVVTQTVTTPTVKDTDTSKEDHKVAHIVVVTHKAVDGETTITKTIDYDNKKDYTTQQQTVSTPTVETKVVTNAKEVDNTQKVNTEIKIYSQPNWRIGVSAGLNATQPVTGKAIDVGLQIDRRIVGPVWLGLYGTKAKEFGLQVSLTF